MLGHKAGFTPTGKGDRVDKEESEDYNDTAQDAPPQLLVHHSLGLLLSVNEILHRRIQRVESPHVECSQSTGKWKHNEKDEWASAIWSNWQTRNSIDHTKDEVSDCEDPDIDHSSAKRGLDDSVTHTDNEKEEEWKWIASRIEHSYNHHKCFGAGIQTMAILEVCGWLVKQVYGIRIWSLRHTVKAPCH